MGSMVANQKTVYEEDPFLRHFSTPCNVRYTLYEHAHLAERQTHFQRDLEQRKIPITFVEKGISTYITWDHQTQIENDTVTIDSAPFLLSGVKVKAEGNMSTTTLTGTLKLTLCENEEPQEHCMTEEQLNYLRRHGFPL